MSCSRWQLGCKGSNGKAPIADCPTQSLLWGGLMLPFPMDAIGVPGCHLNTDILLVALAASNALGEARRSGAIPRDAGFLGFGFRFQALVLDMQANALGLAMSNGSKTRVCGPDPVVRVVATGITQATGQVEVGVSPVTRFSLK